MGRGHDHHAIGGRERGRNICRAVMGRGYSNDRAASNARMISSSSPWERHDGMARRMLRSNRLSAAGQVPLPYSRPRPRFSARLPREAGPVNAGVLAQAGDVVVNVQAPIGHQNIRDPLRIGAQFLRRSSALFTRRAISAVGYVVIRKQPVSPLGSTMLRKLHLRETSERLRESDICCARISAVIAGNLRSCTRKTDARNSSSRYPLAP